MLVYEKETLGFYVSGHPMDRYKKEFRLYKINSIDDVQGFASDRQVTIMAVLVTQTEKKTRDGNEKYATITVDDQTGQLECYISPKLFEKWISIRDSSEPFFIQGHISADNQTGSSKRIWTDNIGRIEEMRKALANSINIYIDILNTKQDTVLKMKEIFLENKGSCHVQIAMTLKDTGDVVLKPDPSWKINPAEKFIERIESLLGEGSVSIL
jgi:DNA polymerase-3 subunit alpha